MELENRIEGFANANGKKFDSANSAYKNYLNADAETPAEEKPDFKTFLDAAKKSGVLDKMLKNKTELKKEEPAPEKKTFKMSTGMIVGVVLGVAAIGTIIYFATRKKKTA